MLFRSKYLGQIPIPEIKPEQGSEVKLKVNKILSVKKSNPSSDTTVLKSEIYRLVYELYGLTEEEIRVVEGIKA